MTLESVTVPLAFAAGAASLLSPCFLPLVPVYVSYLVRSSATTTGEVVVSRGAGTINALSFVAGVSLGFITLFYALRTLLEPVREVIVSMAGVLVIAFALHLAGLIRIPGLNGHYRLVQTAPPFSGPTGGLLLGVAFGAGWPPCIGPVLAAVLTSGATAGTTARGLLMVASYCAGLGLPFILLGLGVGRAAALVSQVSRWRRPIDLTSAALLGPMGLLLLTDSRTAITAFPSQVRPHG